MVTSRRFMKEGRQEEKITETKSEGALEERKEAAPGGGAASLQLPVNHTDTVTDSEGLYEEKITEFFGVQTDRQTDRCNVCLQGCVRAAVCVCQRECVSEAAG